MQAFHQEQVDGDLRDVCQFQTPAKYGGCSSPCWSGTACNHRKPISSSHLSLRGPESVKYAPPDPAKYKSAIPFTLALESLKPTYPISQAISSNDVPTPSTKMADVNMNRSLRKERSARKRSREGKD